MFLFQFLNFLNFLKAISICTEILKIVNSKKFLIERNNLNLLLLFACSFYVYDNSKIIKNIFPTLLSNSQFYICFKSILKTLK